MKLLIAAAISLVVHLVGEQLLKLLPDLEAHKQPPPTIEVRVVEQPPPPPPEPPRPPDPVKPPDAPPPKPTPEPPREVPHPRPATSSIATAPKDAPPPDHPTVQVDGTDEPVFNGGPISMESSSHGPATPTGPAGVAKKPDAGSNAGGATGHGAVIGDFEATKPPLPQGRCFGKYTDEARKAGTEGVVTLSLVVGEDGHARDITVVAGLPNGLTDAAVAALRQCQFSAGEKDGKPIAVHIREFKIRFVLADSQ